jgi:hypothetical protein
MATQLSGTTRNRAILIVRALTLGGAVSALGLTWLFSGLAEAYFSGKTTPTAARVPVVPLSAAPVQQPPTVVTTVVHHPAGAGGAPGQSGPAAPRPPAQGPAAPPAPPPPPVCHSTPSKKC